ncbi:sulfatase-like hydrolase/transferase [Pseudophaeobacter sp.]|uniref:sulfatase-like hydrolase/transferase n=1 Tax=Pseudophaeobacter sp. TaxID=1971739 RepID=UPI0032982E7B
MVRDISQLRWIVAVLRFASILLPGLIALYLILRALWDNDTSDIRYGLGMVVILGLSLFVPASGPQGQRLYRFEAGWVFWLIAIVLIFPITVTALIFGNVDVAAFVFHWVFGVEGTPWGEIIPYVFTTFMYWLALSVTFLRLRPWMAGIRHPNLAFGFGILAINPLIVDLVQSHGVSQFRQEASLVTNFKRIKPAAVTTGKSNPNIIYIFLEGLERTYGEVSAFGDAYAPIRDLGKANLEFTNVQQIYATSWSLSGTVATQCGVPLMVNVFNAIADRSNEDPLVPQAVCMSDLTAARGYRNIYISGAEIAGENQGYFGYSNFYDSHGGANIIDRSDLFEEYGEDQKVNFGGDGWGYRDELVMERTLKEVDHLLANDQPFFLTAATMDTHGPRAFRSDACLAEGEPVITEDIIDAVRCTSKIAEKFLRQLKEKTAGSNTKIVVMSDHLAHRNNATDTLEQFERRNTVIFLQDDLAPAYVEKPGSMLDVFPSVLDWIGWLPASDARAGLGVSLLRGNETLIERLGLDVVNQRLSVDVELSKTLWSGAEGDGI